MKALSSFPSSCFDCASEAEIKLVLSCGVSGSNIIFANPMKPIKAIKFALNNGVQTFTFDSIDELKKVYTYLIYVLNHYIVVLTFLTTQIVLVLI